MNFVCEEYRQLKKRVKFLYSGFIYDPHVLFMAFLKYPKTF